MKNHTIKTPTAELLIVQLPHRTADFSVINTGDRIAISAFDEYDNCLDVMPISTDYTLLGKPAEIMEKDAVEWVDRIGDGDPCYQGDWFVNYQDDESMFETAKESLLSLLESEIYWENPYSGVLAMEFPTAFDNFQLRTFDRNRTLIFVKQ